MFVCGCVYMICVMYLQWNLCGTYVVLDGFGGPEWFGLKFLSNVEFSVRK